MHKFRDTNPTFKTWTLPGSCTNIVSASGGAIRKNGFGRANRQTWEVFTEAIIFKDPLCVSCKASLVCLHFILIKESFCYKSEHLKAFFHASQVVVKNANVKKIQITKILKVCNSGHLKSHLILSPLYFILHYNLTWGNGCTIIYWGWWRKRL